MILRALIFDSQYDIHRGVVALIRIFQGQIQAGQKICFLGTKSSSLCQEVGIFKPQLVPVKTLSAGEVGYVMTGLKDISFVRVGDTIASEMEQKLMLPGYKEVIPKVWASIYPVDSADYLKLKDAVQKLKLNDAALFFEPESTAALGFGFRCGFLGLLHLEIVQERLQREFSLEILVTTPSVQYKILRRQDTAEVQEIRELRPNYEIWKELMKIWLDKK